VPRSGSAAPRSRTSWSAMRVRPTPFLPLMRGPRRSPSGHRVAAEEKESADPAAALRAWRAVKTSASDVGRAQSRQARVGARHPCAARSLRRGDSPPAFAPRCPMPGGIKEGAALPAPNWRLTVCRSLHHPALCLPVPCARVRRPRPRLRPLFASPVLIALQRPSTGRFST
jgi:hypothetical protein